jgi:hypothetical protein
MVEGGKLAETRKDNIPGYHNFENPSSYQSREFFTPVFQGKTGLPPPERLQYSDLARVVGPNFA